MKSLLVVSAFTEAVAATLLHAGLGLKMRRIFLWPAIVAHLVLAIGCLATLWTRRSREVRR